MSDNSETPSLVPGDDIYHKQDICTVLTEIVKIAVPAIISAVLSQVTYMMNFAMAGQKTDAIKLAGLGLGHSVIQALGIMILIGLNSALQTQISFAFGQKKLTLCQKYVN